MRPMRDALTEAMQARSSTSHPTTWADSTDCDTLCTDVKRKARHHAYPGRLITQAVEILYEISRPPERLLSLMNARVSDASTLQAIWRSVASTAYSESLEWALVYAAYRLACATVDSAATQRYSTTGTNTCTGRDADLFEWIGDTAERIAEAKYTDSTKVSLLVQNFIITTDGYARDVDLAQLISGEHAAKGTLLREAQIAQRDLAGAKAKAESRAARECDDRQLRLEGVRELRWTNSTASSHTSPTRSTRSTA